MTTLFHSATPLRLVARLPVERGQTGHKDETMPRSQVQLPGVRYPRRETHVTVGADDTPPAPSAAPSLDCMNAPCASRDDHTSITTNLPLSAVPPQCISSPSGQSPLPVAGSIPSCLFTAS